MAICIAAFVVIVPLLRPGFITTDDGSWMVIRLSAFYQSLREGQFPVRFLGRLNNSYGYPVANFLYPGFLYIGSLIHFLGASYIGSIKIIFAGSVLTGGIFTFLWLRKLTSELPALIGSLSFIFGPYLLFDMYKRGSIGEVLAISVCAVILYAIEARKNFLLGLAFFLLIISHNSIALLFILIFSFLFVLQKNKQGAISLLFGIGMASFFWLPAFYEKNLVRFDSVLVSNPYEYFVSGTLLSLIGFSGLIAFVWYVVNRPEKTNLLYVGSYIITLFLATPLSQFIWQFESFAKLFQFPYRMLAGTLLFGSYILAIMIEKIPSKFRFIVAFVLFVISAWQLKSTYESIIYTDQPEGYYATNEATTTVANEYMPVWVREITQERPTVRMGFQKGRGTIEFTKQTTQKIEATVISLEDSILQINSIYYPGWGVLVNNIPVPLSYDNPNGVIRFPVNKGTYTILAEFRETIPRFIADCLSIFSFIAFCIYKKTR